MGKTLNPDPRDPIRAARQYLAAGEPERAREQLSSWLDNAPANEVATELLAQANLAIAQQRTARSAAVIALADAETDLNRRSGLLKEAADLTPDDRLVQLLLSITDTQREVISFMQERGRFLQEIGRPDESAAESATLALIAPQYALPEQRTADVPCPERERSPAVSPKRTKRLRHWQWVLYGLAAFATLAVAFLIFGFRTPASPAPQGAPLIVQVAQPHASILVDGKPWSGQPLARGKHRLRVSLPGFHPFETAVNVPASAPVVVNLIALGTTVAIDTQPAHTEYSIDDSPPVPLTNGQAAITDLTPGKHTIRLYAQPGGKGETQVEFEADSGKVPSVLRVAPADDTVAVAFGRFGSDAIFLGAPAGLVVKGATGSEILTITDAAAKLTWEMPNEFVIRSSGNEWPVSANSADSPALDIFVRTNAPSGTLLIRVDEDDTVVKLNGRLYGRRLRKGNANTLHGIPPGKYQVTVEREGFRAEPAATLVTVSRGQETQVSFHLLPLAVIQIRDAIEGARVFVNGTDAGAVNAAGTAVVHADAGPCRIELRLPKYRHRAVERQCSAGTPTAIAGAEAALEPTFGFAQITSVQPKEARIVAIRPGEPEHVLSVGEPELPVGRYMLRVTAPGYQTWELPQMDIPPGRMNVVGPIVLRPAK
jgi:hypothetical protein